MIYGTHSNTPSLNRSSQPADCTEQVETCRTVLLRLDAQLPVLKVPAFPLDRTRQQHSPYLLIKMVDSKKKKNEYNTLQVQYRITN